MPTVAFRFLGIRGLYTIPTQQIFSRRYCIQVRRIAAIPAFTEVIQCKTIRYSADNN